MKLEHYPEEKLKREILEIIGKYIDLGEYKVFFFGSRVAGKADERSDIDVGIEGPEEAPAQALFDIQEEIENLPTLYKIEVVDFTRVDNTFKEVALQFTETISEPA